MRKPFRDVVTTGLMLALAACGGGGGGGGVGGPQVADTGVGGSGGVTGPVQGFGSIIINDLVMDVDEAEFEIEGAAAGIGVQARLAEGQQLLIRGDLDALRADAVFYRSDVKGPLAADPVFDPLTGVGQMAVLGQAVRVNATTRYDRGAALDTLAAGSQVAISGARNARGELVATWIGLESGLATFKVVGRVDAVAAPGFTIGALGVDIETNGLASPEVGDLVEVRFPSSALVPGEPVAATAVETLGEVELDDGERYEIQGFIDSFDSTSRFTVGGVAVTVPAGVRFEDGTADDLALNVRVEVEGSANSAGQVVAERIIFKPTEAIRVEGTVAAVDVAAGTVTTTVGLTFIVRELTELEDESELGVEPLTLEDLNEGGVDFVEIRGFREGADLIAAEVERDDFDPRTRLRGPLDDAPVLGADGNLQLRVLGIELVASPSVTQFEDDADAPLTQSEFAALVGAGTVVEAEWDPFSSTAAVVDALSIEEEDDD